MNACTERNQARVRCIDPACRPDATRYTWHAAVEVDAEGTQRFRIEGLLGPDRQRCNAVEFTQDPAVMAGFDGPGVEASPVEWLLAGLVGCLAAEFIRTAAEQAFPWRKLAIELEADVDMMGYLGFDLAMNPALENLAVRYRITADAASGESEAVVALAQSRSALLELVRRPGSFRVDVSAD